jgi:hypothetical protein
MKENFSSFDLAGATPVAVPLDFSLLCMLLARAQAQSPTARIAAEPEARSTGDNPRVENAIIVFRNEDGRDRATSAMGGSFHAGAAGHVSE